MIDKNGKIRLKNMRLVEEVDLEASSREQRKLRLNVTVLPTTSNWLKGRGNASLMIDELVEAAIVGNLEPADHPLEKLEELIRENSELKAAVSQLQSQVHSQPEKESARQDYQAIRDQVLTSLKLGKQAPGYKSAVKALDRFIAELQ